MNDQMSDQTRARRIVVLASKEKTSASKWLFLDEFGTWEKLALELLEKSRERAVELKLTEDEVNEQIATKLTVLALEAMIAGKKKELLRKAGMP